MTERGRVRLTRKAKEKRPIKAKSQKAKSEKKKETLGPSGKAYPLGLLGPVGATTRRGDGGSCGGGRVMVGVVLYVKR